MMAVVCKKLLVENVSHVERETEEKDAKGS